MSIVNFHVNSELEPIVRIIARLRSKTIGLSSDDPYRELPNTIEELASLIKLQGPEKLSEYLRPYAGLNESPGRALDAEWCRWFAAVAVERYIMARNR
jgi:hypothetical protein